jgi:phosphatidylserine/phosphatidylglycerophosphate/cardiolipin synthase-like enzyme
MIQLSSIGEVRAAISDGGDVDVLAYTLARGPVLGALEAAASRGVRVKVRLEGAPFGDPDGALARHNRRVVDELATFGVDARLAHAQPGGDAEAPVHAKALVAGGRVFLDDRNWRAGDFVVCNDDPGAVQSVVDAVNGKVPRDVPGSAFALEKENALAREVQLLRSAHDGDDVVAESESFGYGTVYAALDDLGKRGLAPRLLVSAREAANRRESQALQRLAGDGVRVRITRDAEKFALVDDRAWIGSANASPAFGDPEMLDWGLCTDDRAIAGAARVRVEARWATAEDWKPLA